jgi:hypothetical protein
VTFDPIEIDKRLRERSTWVVRTEPDGQHDVWILDLGPGRSGIEVEFDGELVWIAFGRVHLSLADDDEDPAATVLAVAEAMALHRAQEIYGRDSEGAFGYLGHFIDLGTGAFGTVPNDGSVQELFRIDL